MERIARLGERNVAPFGAGAAHVHGHAAVAAARAIEHAGGGFERQVIGAALLHQEIGDAARAVAAGAGFPSRRC